MFLCDCGEPFELRIASEGGQSAGKAYGGPTCGNKCYLQLTTEEDLKRMYEAFSGGKLKIGNKGRGMKSRDPAIPPEWAAAMFSLVNAHDSAGNPIFNPTQVNEKEPKKGAELHTAKQEARRRAGWSCCPGREEEEVEEGQEAEEEQEKGQHQVSAASAHRVTVVILFGQG